MGLLVLIAGLAALGFGLFQHLKGKRILAAPFKKTGELLKDPTSPDPKGAMSTEGKVVPPAEALLSPCTKQPCLAFEVKVERLWEKVETTQDGTKTVSGSDTLETVRGGAIFGVDDGSGAINVDVSKGADFDNYKDGYKKELNGRAWSSSLQFGEMHFEVPVLTGSDKYTVGFRATERFVPVEGNLFVLGKMEGAAIVKPSWRSLLISNKGREGLLGSIAKKKKFSFIGGGVAAVLSIPLMIFAPKSTGSSSGHSYCDSALTGAVAKCSGNVSLDSGETFTWNVTRKDTYDLTVWPAAGKKIQLDPIVQIEDAEGNLMLDADAVETGQAVKGSVELLPGLYMVKITDRYHTVVSGGLSFELQIAEQHPEVKAAPAVAAKDDQDEAKPTAKLSAKERALALAKSKGKSSPKTTVTQAEPVKPSKPEPVAAAPAPVRVADPLAIRAGVVSCNLPSNGSCTEYAAHTDAAQKGCQMFKGEYAKKACKRDGAVAACAMNSGDVNVIYAGGPMGITRKTAGMMCPSSMGALTLAPETQAVEPEPTKVAAVEPVKAAPAPVKVVEVAAAPEADMEISAKALTALVGEMNEACTSKHCQRGFDYIFTNLSCDKSAKWCQLDIAAKQRSTRQGYSASLPFTPAGKTRSAFDSAITTALRAFEAEPKSGKLASVVMPTEKKAPVAAAAPQPAPAKTRVAEPLAKKEEAAPAPRTVAVAPTPAPKPVADPPAPRAAPSKKSAPAAPVSASKNMAD